MDRVPVKNLSRPGPKVNCMSAQTTNVRTLSRAAAALLLAGGLAAPGLAAAQTLTIGNGTDPTGTPATVCPGGAATVVDAFSLTAAVTADSVSRITVQLTPTGAWANVGLVEILNSGNTVVGSAIPGGDLVSVYTGALAIPVGTSNFTIRVTPRTHAAMPPPAQGQLFGVGALVSSVASNNPRSGADTASFSVNIDNAPSPNVALTTATVGSTTLNVNWAASTQVVVLRRTNGVVLDAPVDGTAYATGNTIGSSTVAFAGTAAGFADAALTTGVGYYYKIFTVDPCVNYSVGVAVGPLYPGGSNEGDTTPGSIKPVVAVINPMKGGVLTKNAAGFKVQVRAFSPKNAGATQPLTSVRLKAATGAATFTNTACDAANYPIALSQNTRYPNAVDSAIYEVATLTDITGLAAGAYVFRACAQNASGIVISSAVPVQINAGTAGARGDGNLLVRDNSAQLCSDCHDPLVGGHRQQVRLLVRRLPRLPPAAQHRQRRADQGPDHPAGRDRPAGPAHRGVLEPEHRLHRQLDPDGQPGRRRLRQRRRVGRLPGLSHADHRLQERRLQHHPPVRLAGLHRLPRPRQGAGRQLHRLPRQRDPRRPRHRRRRRAGDGRAAQGRGG
jgi:hypothetical protein